MKNAELLDEELLDEMYRVTMLLQEAEFGLSRLTRRLDQDGAGGGCRTSDVVEQSGLDTQRARRRLRLELGHLRHILNYEQCMRCDKHLKPRMMREQLCVLCREREREREA